MDFHNIAFVLVLVLSQVEGAPSASQSTRPWSPNLEADNNHLRRSFSGPSVVQANSVTNHSYLWTAPVVVGNVDQSLIIDIGSADIWVEPGLPSAVAGEQPYNPNTSPEFKADESKGFSMTDLITERTLSGTTATDVVGFGYAFVDNQEIAVVPKDAGSSPVVDGYNGVFGLGYTKPSTGGASSFIAAIRPALSKPIFTINLHSDSSTSTLSFGDPTIPIELGDTPPTVPTYSGNLTTVNVSTNRGSIPNFLRQNGTLVSGGWIIPGVSWGTNLRSGMSLPTMVILDTTLPSVFLAQDIAAAYYDQVDGAVTVAGKPGSWTVPCNATLPDLVLTFSANEQATGATAPVASMRRAVIDGDVLRDYTSKEPLIRTNSCPGPIIGNTDGVNRIGIPFFIDRYVEFNVLTPSISFADSPVSA